MDTGACPGGSDFCVAILSLNFFCVHSSKSTRVTPTLVNKVIFLLTVAIECPHLRARLVHALRHYYISEFELTSRRHSDRNQNTIIVRGGKDRQSIY